MQGDVKDRAIGTRTRGRTGATGTTRTAGLVAVALALGGCASMSKQDCLAGNWYEQGYEDANGGERSDRLDAHAKACAKVGAVPDGTVYGRGYEAGLADFCTPQRGYDLGVRDADYRDICPAGTEAAFLDRYVDGLERALVQREIDAVSAEADFERALVARAAIAPGRSTKKADARVDAARGRMESLRSDRLGIREKIRRWSDELSAL